MGNSNSDDTNKSASGRRRSGTDRVSSAAVARTKDECTWSHCASTASAAGVRPSFTSASRTALPSLSLAPGVVESGTEMARRVHQPPRSMVPVLDPPAPAAAPSPSLASSAPGSSSMSCHDMADDVDELMSLLARRSESAEPALGSTADAAIGAAAAAAAPLGSLRGNVADAARSPLWYRGDGTSDDPGECVTVMTPCGATDDKLGTGTASIISSGGGTSLASMAASSTSPSRRSSASPSSAARAATRAFSLAEFSSPSAALGRPTIVTLRASSRDVWRSASQKMPSSGAVGSVSRRLSMST
mmetsp:Transcript_5686/g.20390  ORF Transcript_5686/g.20390 Transcript_5686/m.20390 type:complete len:302 (+) Transcript_5686:1687-2592(+)